MNRFSNWSGSVQFTPRKISLPQSEEEIEFLVTQAAHNGTNIRVVGTGHSFTSLIETKDTLLSLDRMQGLIDEDAKTGDITLWGGTKLWHMNELFFHQGRAIANLGDIDRQSIAGTVSTGTHGTGISLGSISTQLKAITLIPGDGKKRVLTEADGDAFRAAQVSLGALGVITKVQLKTLPAYKLKLDQKKEKLDYTLAHLTESAAQNRHFEFFFFPYSDAVQAKYVNQTELPAQKKTIGTYFNDIVLENVLFKILSEISRWVPGAYQTVAKICGAAIGAAEKVNWSHRIFSMPRYVKFQEMEFSVPAADMASVILELREMIERKKIRVHFPVECRYVKGDTIPLSPAYGRDSAYIAIHMYRGMEYREYFEAAQSIFRNHGGRPHWGKMHFLTAKELRPLYPEWDVFERVRSELDPKGIFLNATLRQLLCST